MSKIWLQSAQIFPPKDLAYFWQISRLHLKAQTFFPPKDLDFFSNAKHILQGEIFSSINYLEFFDSRKKYI